MLVFDAHQVLIAVVRPRAPTFALAHAVVIQTWDVLCPAVGGATSIVCGTSVFLLLGCAGHSDSLSERFVLPQLLHPQIGEVFSYVRGANIADAVHDRGDS